MLHIGRNIISLLISRVAAAVVLFLVYTRLAQYLGPEAAGQYGLLAGILSIFSLFVDLGMSQLVIKKISEDREHSSKYLSNYFIVQFILAFIFGLIMAGFVFLNDYPQEVKNALYIASIALFLSSLSLPFKSIINAFQKLTIIAKVNFANSMINAGMMVLAIVFTQGIFFLAFIGILISFVDLVVYGFVTNKYYAKFRLEVDWAFVRQLFIWTWPFTLLTFFSIYNRIDTIMLPHFRGFEETGYYSVAYKFWDVLAFLPAVVGISLYPYFAERLSVGAKQDARKIIETYTRYMIALAVPISVGAFMVSGDIVQTFYGAEFLPASTALWLLIAAVSVLLVYSPVNSLILSQQTKAATWITGFTLLFNFTTNIIFIPKYGFIAAAATTLASELIQAIGYTYIVRNRVVDYRIFGNFIKPILATTLMAISLLWLQPRLEIWISISIAVVVYALALYIFKFFQTEDRDLFIASVSFRKNV